MTATLDTAPDRVAAPLPDDLPVGTRLRLLSRVPSLGDVGDVVRLAGPCSQDVRACLLVVPLVASAAAPPSHVSRSVLALADAEPLSVGARARVLSSRPWAADLEPGETVEVLAARCEVTPGDWHTGPDGSACVRVSVPLDGSRGTRDPIPGGWHVPASALQPVEPERQAAEPEPVAEAEPDPVAVEVAETLARILDAYGAGGRMAAEPLVAEAVEGLARRAASQVARADEAQRRALSERREAVAAFVGMADRMADEADRRSWCSEWSDFADEVAGSLPSWVASDFLEACRLERDFTVAVPVAAVVYVTVRTRSEDDAREYAAESWQDFADGVSDFEPSETSGYWDVSED